MAVGWNVSTDAEGISYGEVPGDALTVSRRARERCMAMSTSIVRCRSLISGSLRSYERTSVGESRGRSSLGLALFRRRIGDPPRIEVGEVDKIVSLGGELIVKVNVGNHNDVRKQDRVAVQYPGLPSSSRGI